MIIRKMKPSDVEQVAAIEAQCFSMPWSEKGFLDSIAREDTIFLVAELDKEPETKPLDISLEEEKQATTGDRIAGYIGMYTSFEEGEITNVAVSSEYRKQGIGNLLVTAMQSAGKEQKLERIVLEVRVSNERALSLYKRNGFKELGIRKNFYEKPTEDAIIMSCGL
jgi:ribosomal-protein-alanine N-acetyltransferase